MKLVCPNCNNAAFWVLKLGFYYCPLTWGGCGLNVEEEKLRKVK